MSPRHRLRTRYEPVPPPEPEERPKPSVVAPAAPEPEAAAAAAPPARDEAVVTEAPVAATATPEAPEAPPVPVVAPQAPAEVPPGPRAPVPQVPPAPAPEVPPVPGPPAPPPELPPAPAPEVPPVPTPAVPPSPAPPPPPLPTGEWARSEAPSVPTPEARVAPTPDASPAPATGVPPARPLPPGPVSEAVAPPVFEAPPAPPRPSPWAAVGRRLRGLLTVVVFAALAFVTGLLLFNNLVMPRLIHGRGEVEVPDLVNLTVQQAEQAVRPLGLQISRAGERFDPSAPRGFVLSQDPTAGTRVRGNRRISVLVSLGEEFSSVPELFGESVRAARMLIERAGLRPGTIVQAPSEDAGQGLVIGSDPGAEAVLPRDTRVHLLVSTGPGEESYVMPDLLGREVLGVRRQLEALGFRIELSGSARQVGTIVWQNPTAGSRIHRASVIQVRATGRVIR